MHLYFAFGSNLSLRQMKTRCPNSERIGIAVLADYRWGISCRGYANVYPSQDDAVYGVLYTLTPTDEENLDRYEGVAIGSYNKVELEVMLQEVDDGSEKVKRALVYIDPREEEGHPRREYIGRLRIGLKDAHLPEKWVEHTIEPVLSSGRTYEGDEGY